MCPECQVGKLMIVMNGTALRCEECDALFALEEPDIDRDDLAGLSEMTLAQFLDRYPNIEPD